MVWADWRVIYVLWTKELDKKEKCRPPLRKINHSQNNDLKFYGLLAIDNQPQDTPVRLLSADT